MLNLPVLAGNLFCSMGYDASMPRELCPALAGTRDVCNIPDLSCAAPVARSLAFLVVFHLAGPGEVCAGEQDRGEVLWVQGVCMCWSLQSSVPLALSSSWVLNHKVGF